MDLSGIEWIKDTFQFDENLIKKYNEESDEWYFLQVSVQYRQKFYEIHNNFPFLTETKWRLKNRNACS